MNERLRQLLVAHFMSALLAPLQRKLRILNAPLVDGLGESPRWITDDHIGLAGGKASGRLPVPDRLGNRERVAYQEDIEMVGIIGVGVTVVGQAW